VDKNITVLVVEDDAMVRRWVELALEQTEFRVAGTARTAHQAVDLIERRRPELLLIDYRLNSVRGSDLIRDLRTAGIDITAVLMTANAEPGFNELAREAGAQGTILKTGNAAELLRGLRGASAGGETAFDDRYPARTQGQSPLSPRERETLRLVAAGATNRQVAAKLGIGEETVKTILGRAFLKLGAHRRAEAVATAAAAGLI
jgi:DNA-binding NarL/FixJ family response regulator